MSEAGCERGGSARSIGLKMSYQIYITRRDICFDKNGANISFEEWRILVSSDTELQIVGFAEVSLLDKTTLRIEAAGITEWNGHPTSQTVWLVWDDIHISCKNPDDIIIRKMIGIASKLQARVQGDEGEFYD